MRKWNYNELFSINYMRFEMSGLRTYPLRKSSGYGVLHVNRRGRPFAGRHFGNSWGETYIHCYFNNDLSQEIIATTNGQIFAFADGMTAESYTWWSPLASHFELRGTGETQNYWCGADIAPDWEKRSVRRARNNLLLTLPARLSPSLRPADADVVIIALKL